MTYIDWSKAPEWADSVWRGCVTGGLYWVSTATGETLRMSDSFSGAVFDKYSWEKIGDRPSAWTGSGLPPVGTVCEFICTARGKEREWQPALVKYASPFTVVLDDYSATAGELEGEFVAHPDTMVFRPIRTPEQIAAEEREKAVAEMQAMIDNADWSTGYSRAFCEMAYDAGYRKTEAP